MNARLIFRFTFTTHHASVQWLSSLYVSRYRSANYPVVIARLCMPRIDQHYDTIVPDFTCETPRQFSTEPIDKTAYGAYTASKSKQQLGRFLDEVYMLPQHPCSLGLVHFNRFESHWKQESHQSEMHEQRPNVCVIYRGSIWQKHQHQKRKTSSWKRSHSCRLEEWKM
jgi:hypothetical protein